MAIKSIYPVIQLRYVTSLYSFSKEKNKLFLEEVHVFKMLIEITEEGKNRKHGN